MSRALLILFVSALLLGISSPARALIIRVTEIGGGCCAPSDEFTIGIRLIEEAGDEDIVGLGISVHQYGDNEFVRGRAVSSYLHTFTDPAIGAFGGLFNLAEGDLVESAIGANGNRVQIALSATIVPRPPFTDPPPSRLDPGLDGVIGGGDSMFELTFRVVTGATLRIGTGYEGDGVIVGDGSTRQARGASASITLDGLVITHDPVPEPNTTLLLGLGLATLSARRARA